MVVLFVAIFGSILLYGYKGNISKEEIAIEIEEKEYIISKLNQLGEIKKKQKYDY